MLLPFTLSSNVVLNGLNEAGFVEVRREPDF